jgi:hypothetical protein
MPNPGYYQNKLSKCGVLPCKGIEAEDLAERVYYMYLAQQERIVALEAALAKARIEVTPQPTFVGEDGDDPCCCVGGKPPEGCPPICINC